MHLKEAIAITRSRIAKDKMEDEAEALQKWRDWRWQIGHTIRKIETVEKILHVSFSDEMREQIQMTMDRFPMAITPYYLSLVDPDNYENDPVFKQAFPDVRELEISKCDMEDPLHEDKDSPVTGITHRYPDRVLFHVSNVCGMYCRHCTRKRKVGDRDHIPSRDIIMEGIEYIRNTPQVRDVLLSGGDPFLLSDEYIDWILGEISSINHVEVIRIGTRTPVVLPARITDGLIEVLRKYDNIWLNTHFNHPREITDSAREALKKLSGAGIPLGNQSVLLAGGNDGPRIIKALIGHTSGFAVPTYVIDAPGGGGKIPIMPNYLITWSTDKVVLRNYEGVITSYKMPGCYTHTCGQDCENCNLELNLNESDESKSIGVARLLSDPDEDITLVPQNLEREQRNEGGE